MLANQIKRLLLLALCVVSLSNQAQEWTRFRGPNGSGHSAARNFPAQWSEKDFNWKIELPGSGHSSPVLWGQKIFLTSTAENPSRILILCLKASDGAVLWRKEIPFTQFPKHPFNSFASSTPAVDAARLYVAWSTPDRYSVRAFNHSGQTLWEQNLGPYVSQHGSGTSPVVVGDKIILANDQDGESFLVALDAASGSVRWKIPQRHTHNGVSYSTPCVYEPKPGAKELIFTSWPNGVTAVDLDSGKIAWDLPDVFDKRCVSSPIVAGGLIVGSCGSGGGGNYVAAIRPPDGERNRAPELVYKIKKSAPYVPCAMAVGNLLFLWSDAGIVTCADAASGQIRWQERLGGRYFGSPVCVDGKLFCVSSTGEVVAIEASDEFKVLGRNALGELSHATPAVDGGRMYVRTYRHLYSIGRDSAEAKK